MKSYLSEIDQLNRRIQQRIQEHADTYGLTYEESANRSYLTVNGIKIKPAREDRFSIDYDSDKPKSPHPGMRFSCL